MEDQDEDQVGQLLSNYSITKNMTIQSFDSDLLWYRHSRTATIFLSFACKPTY